MLGQDIKWSDNTNKQLHTFGERHSPRQRLPPSHELINLIKQLPGLRYGGDVGWKGRRAGVLQTVGPDLGAIGGCNPIGVEHNPLVYTIGCYNYYREE